MQNKNKVLFLTGKLQKYRIPIFNLIVKNSNINLTVGHYGKKLTNDNALFNEIILKEKNIWKFKYHGKELKKLCNDFDVVVAMMYLKRLSFMNLLFLSKKKFKLIYWGIGVRASLKNKYDSPSVFNKFRSFLIKKSDATIFYSDYAREKYIAQGIDSKKLFVMQNTVVVNDIVLVPIQKKKILFVGTLYKSKKLFELLNAYKEAHSIKPQILGLDIIGNGSEYDAIRLWIEENKLTENVDLHGAIYDEVVLENFFKTSLVTISPGQAGLSVLKSMGYGVPFITRVDSITGGERFNIKNGYNGVLYNNKEELINILVDICENPTKYIEMGSNAKKYYFSERTPEIMSKGFIDAVNFVSKN